MLKVNKVILGISGLFLAGSVFADQSVQSVIDKMKSLTGTSTAPAQTEPASTTATDATATSSSQPASTTIVTPASATPTSTTITTPASSAPTSTTITTPPSPTPTSTMIVTPASTAPTTTTIVSPASTTPTSTTVVTPATTTPTSTTIVTPASSTPTSTTVVTPASAVPTTTVTPSGDGTGPVIAPPVGTPDSSNATDISKSVMQQDGTLIPATMTPTAPGFGAGGIDEKAGFSSFDYLTTLKDCKPGVLEAGVDSVEIKGFKNQQCHVIYNIAGRKVDCMFSKAQLNKIITKDKLSHAKDFDRGVGTVLGPLSTDDPTSPLAQCSQ